MRVNLGLAAGRRPGSRLAAAGSSSRTDVQGVDDLRHRRSPRGLAVLQAVLQRLGAEQVDSGMATAPICSTAM
jgi:hypothetical protein